jgi:hypothetical protein
MKHFISLDKAKKMTALYRKEKDNIVTNEHKEKKTLPLCESFDAEPFRVLLNKQGCVGIRIYCGMDDEKKVHFIVVGINDKNEDILPDEQSTNLLSTAVSNTTTSDTTSTDDTTTTGDSIIEDGIPCPPSCPPPSPLNS